jgi:putative transposase
MDNPTQGPVYLQQPEFAKIVVTSIHKGVELGHYELGAYVVMPNHVHLLVRPLVAPDRLLRSLKGATARAANLLLGQTGEPFWQKESYDHWVRNDGEFLKIRAYIENSPVKAGLVLRPEEFRWSSACIETSLDAARTSAYATS